MRSASLVVASDHTRIVFESDGPVRFGLLALRNPDRLALDLEGVGLDSVVKAFSGKVDPRHPFIRSVRISAIRPDQVRIDFSLDTEVEPRMFAEAAKAGQAHRLTLEIYRSDAATVTAVPAKPVAPPTALPPVQALAELLLAISINRQPSMETAVILRGRDGSLMARADDLRRWRLLLPKAAPISHGGEDYYPLALLPGLAYEVNEATQTLALEAPAGLFEATSVAGQRSALVVPDPPSPGGFANYDVLAEHVEGKGIASAQLEIGAFNAWGVGVSSFLGRSSGPGQRWVRLETTWTHDRPAQIATVRIGDAITGTASWGRAVRFGGVQWATNFATQPHLITFPLPSLAGEAVLPSTVDLYVNDALRLRREVPTGPFSIQDLPVVSGRGDMRLVVRDLLGRERVLVVPFYASARLLQNGLHDYSYEAGFVRSNFGATSNDYGRFVAAGTHRRGFTDHFTGELHGELLRDQQTLGAGAALLFQDLGVLSASIAGSNHRTAGQGALMVLGFESQTRTMSFGASTQIASRDFVQLGLQPGEVAPRQIGRAFLSFAVPKLGSFGLGYAHQDYRDREDVDLLSATYSISLGRWGFFSASALRFFGLDAKTVVGLNYTVPLDQQTSASIGATSEPSSRQGQLQVQRNLPPGSGFGYRVMAAAGDSDRIEASVSAQNAVGTYRVEAARADGATGYRASVAGGVAVLGWNAFLGRGVQQSFAVVEIPQYPNVRVYAANQLVARTNADGLALLPSLLPYQRNAVRIEQADLPMDAQVGAVQVDAVPYFRSGVRLPFPIKRSRGAMVTIVLENGAPLPAGALVRIVPGGESFPAGLRGEVYLTGLGASNRLRAAWHDRECVLDVAFPDTVDPLPHLGTHVCRAERQ